MRDSKAARYSISVGFLYTALTLPFDLHGYATMIGEAWPVIAAFLPLIGTMLAVSTGVWIVWNRAIDVPQACRRSKMRRENRRLNERQELVKAMRFVAENVRVLDNIGNPELALRVRLGMDYLTAMKIAPRDLDSWASWHFHLHRLIPIVEAYGIEEAQRSATEIENKSQNGDSSKEPSS